MSGVGVGYVESMRNRLLRCAGCLLLATLLLSCHSVPKPEPPQGTDEVLALSTDAALLHTPGRLEPALHQIENGRQHALFSVLVARDGQLVFERYFNQRRADTPHDIRSATKSITALLAGVAIHQGVLTASDQSIAPVLDPRYPNVAIPADLQVDHLLTMSSGKACDDHEWRSPGNENRMYRSEDWTRFFLELEQKDRPGTVPVYCTGGVIVLGRVMQEALADAGEDDFTGWADKVLFHPLGIGNYSWARYGEDGVDTGGHLLITPQGLLRIGMMLVDGGRWNGNQIVPKQWLAAMWMPRVELGGQDYGYLWWINTVDYGSGPITVMSARGNGGQTLFVVPELRLVSVITTGYYNRPQARLADELFFFAILPDALESPSTSRQSPAP